MICISAVALYVKHRGIARDSSEDNVFVKSAKPQDLHSCQPMALRGPPPVYTVLAQSGEPGRWYKICRTRDHKLAIKVAKAEQADSYAPNGELLQMFRVVGCPGCLLPAKDIGAHIICVLGCCVDSVQI